MQNTTRLHHNDKIIQFTHTRIDSDHLEDGANTQNLEKTLNLKLEALPSLAPVPIKKSISAVYTIDLYKLESPITLHSYLINKVESLLAQHFMSFWRHKQKVIKINLHFYFSQTKRFMLELNPKNPSFEMSEFLDVLEDQIRNVPVNAPIKSIELEILRQA